MKKTILFYIVLVFLLLPSIVFAADEIDSDNDGMADTQEAKYYTDLHNPDTDGDGFTDGEEVKNDYSPHVGEQKRLNEFDYDGDGLNDWLERWFKTDMGKGDSDADGVNDFEEIMKGSNPAVFGTSTVFTRKIEVDRSYQRLYYFVDGVKIVNMPVSTGNPSTPTPAGDFSVLKKKEVVWYKGTDYDFPNTKWNLEFKPHYYLHSAYWHNDFAKRTRSHGCVNMRFDDAALLFKYIDIGVPVVVTGVTPKRYYVGT